ncbi:beta-ketoacyl-ACP synthase II [Wansuia hejianensis]|uniref:3-oxoacyl-[acyl-carrier-protein] synthase 2 n=1 Tax=Wansuia hejianensis TaxID=2763667 RepID=A0A926EZ41_9FIRM|nr:beta-ketoacyl-ACP synthase II [Wansuia hejianensis]MBC8591023.1 beta-ketoacyl-ACP synthase II [Wansuia hejianensis]
MRRVVITGLGAITPIGLGKEEFWDSLIHGKSGIGPITRFNTDKFTTRIAAEVKNFNPENYIDKREARRMDKFAQYAVAAAKLAIEDGNISLDEVDKYKIGVILGTGIGGMETFEKEHSKLIEKGPGRVSPLFIPMMISNIGAGQVSMNLGLKGSSMTITTACASGTHAIGESFRIIRNGKLNMVLAGGAEAAITPISLAGFNSMKALSTRNEDFSRACRPFDKDRDGFIMGEGAGILVLEELNHALSRDATIYGEIVGYGSTSDAFHITQPDPDAIGAINSMKEAIEDANIQYESIGYINAHGTSTYFNDKLETLAIKKVFKNHAYNLNISSTKSMTGHLLGAAGGIEAIATVLALKTGIIPPTINYENPDDECDLDYTANKAVKKDIEYGLSNSLGFGGHNGSLLIKKYNG